MELIDAFKAQISVVQACEWLGVPRSTYYRWKAIDETKQSDLLVEQIRELCTQHKFRYGYRKITALLRKELKVNHKRVQRVMQQEQLQCRVKVKKRKAAGQPACIAENLLKRKFEADAPMQKLVTDITYLPFGGKMLYLSSILDLFNGEIVASSISDRQNTAFVLDTLNQLPDLPGAVLHSD